MIGALSGKALDALAVQGQPDVGRLVAALCQIFNVLAISW